MRKVVDEPVSRAAPAEARPMSIGAGAADLSILKNERAQAIRFSTPTRIR